MTNVTTTLRSAYLAGPMRGIEEYNFPAFHKAAAWLRSEGWKILSPAERDEADESIRHDQDRAGWADHLGLDYFMQFDLAMVCEADCVICLEGWEKSQGARLETLVAIEVGHPVFELVKKRRLGRMKDWYELRSKDWYELRSINPDYVREQFLLNAFPEGFWTRTPLPEHSQYVPGCGCECSIESPPDPGDNLVVVEGSALPHDSEGRKAVPLATGVLDYFPAALAEVARVSKAGNDKHNPGQPMHHARGKSTDHADCLLRHLVDRGKVDPETGQRHSGEVAWRALALLQEELEDEGLAPLPRGARE